MKANLVRENYIYFTNLDTVKSTKFELTSKAFFNKMRELINNDYMHNGVFYDEKIDQYTIVYKKDSYEVKYGKDYLTNKCEDESIVEQLNRLVEVTKQKKDVVSENIERNRYQEQEKKKSLENAEKGILRTNAEKLAKIELINEKYKNGDNSSLLKGIKDTFKKMNFGKVSEHAFYHQAITGAVLAVIGVLLLAITQNGVFPLVGVALELIFGVSGLSAATSEGSSRGYRGLIYSILSVLTFPLNVVYNLVKKIINVIKHNIEVDNIKKQMTKKQKVTTIPKSKINIDELNKYLETSGIASLKSTPTNLTATIELISELRDKILTINDEQLSKKFATELYETISYYIDSSINIKEKEKVLLILSNQIIDLSKRVDDELNKEKERINDNCDNLVEYIEHQKSIGTR